MRRFPLSKISFPQSLGELNVTGSVAMSILIHGGYGGGEVKDEDTLSISSEGGKCRRFTVYCFFFFGKQNASTISTPTVRIRSLPHERTGSWSASASVSVSTGDWACGAVIRRLEGCFHGMDDAKSGSWVPHPSLARLNLPSSGMHASERAGKAGEFFQKKKKNCGVTVH